MSYSTYIHKKCPSGADSWCKYQVALATTGEASFKHNYEPLPQDVLDAIKPIYEDLSEDELLKRCLGGFTQNNNESLNKGIWAIAPKKLSGSFQIVDVAARVAASTFNKGNYALLKFLDEMSIDVGPSAHEWAENADQERVNRAEVQATAATKQARTERRVQKNQKIEESIAAGEVMCGAGIDDSL